MWTVPNSAFSFNSIYETKLLTRPRIGLSHIKEHKFNHRFRDIINRCCSCCLEIELTSHFILRYQNFISALFMDELSEMIGTFLKLNETSLTGLLLSGDSKYENKKRSILASLNFLFSTNQFGDQLMWQIYAYLQVPISFCCLYRRLMFIYLFASLQLHS